MIAIAENTQTGTIDLPLTLTMHILTHLSIEDNPHFIPSNSPEAEKYRHVLTKPGRNMRNKLWKRTEIEKWKKNNVKEANKYIVTLTGEIPEDEEEEKKLMQEDQRFITQKVCQLYIIYKHIFKILIIKHILFLYIGYLIYNIFMYNSINIQQYELRKNATFSDDLIFKNEIVPLLKLTDTDMDIECSEETYWDLYERKVVEISDDVYHNYSFNACVDEDIIYTMHDIFFEFQKQLYTSFVVNAKDYSWRALIFNLGAFNLFYFAYGEAESRNKEFIDGIDEQENVVVEEPGANCFGILTDEELENRGAPEGDFVKHKGMLFILGKFICIYILYKV